MMSVRCCLRQLSIIWYDWFCILHLWTEAFAVMPWNWLATKLMIQQTCYKVDDSTDLLQGWWLNWLATKLMIQQTCYKVDDSTDLLQGWWLNRLATRLMIQQTCYNVDDSTDLLQGWWFNRLATRLTTQQTCYKVDNSTDLLQGWWFNRTCYKVDEWWLIILQFNMQHCSNVGKMPICCNLRKHCHKSWQNLKFLLNTF